MKFRRFAVVELQAAPMEWTECPWFLQRRGILPAALAGCCAGLYNRAARANQVSGDRGRQGR
jgi:hypothetical protein